MGTSSSSPGGVKRDSGFAAGGVSYTPSSLNTEVYKLDDTCDVPSTHVFIGNTIQDPDSFIGKGGGVGLGLKQDGLRGDNNIETSRLLLTPSPSPSPPPSLPQPQPLAGALLRPQSQERVPDEHKTGEHTDIHVVYGNKPTGRGDGSVRPWVASIPLIGTRAISGEVSNHNSISVDATPEVCVATETFIRKHLATPLGPSEASFLMNSEPILSAFGLVKGRMGMRRTTRTLVRTSMQSQPQTCARGWSCISPCVDTGVVPTTSHPRIVERVAVEHVGDRPPLVLWDVGTSASRGVAHNGCGVVVAPDPLSSSGSLESVRPPLSASTGSAWSKGGKAVLYSLPDHIHTCAMFLPAQDLKLELSVCLLVLEKSGMWVPLDSIPMYVASAIVPIDKKTAKKTIILNRSGECLQFEAMFLFIDVIVEVLHICGFMLHQHYEWERDQSPILNANNIRVWARRLAPVQNEPTSNAEDATQDAVQDAVQGLHLCVTVETVQIHNIVSGRFGAVPKVV